MHVLVVPVDTRAGSDRDAGGPSRYHVIFSSDNFVKISTSVRRLLSARIVQISPAGTNKWNDVM